MKVVGLNKSYRLFADNGKDIGSFQLDSDGFYYFWQDEDLVGCWTAHNLREIADELDKVNKPYRNSIEEYFRKENDKKDNCQHDFELVFDFTDMESYICKKCGYEKFNV